MSPPGGRGPRSAARPGGSPGLGVHAVAARRRPTPAGRRAVAAGRRSRRPGPWSSTASNSGPDARPGRRPRRPRQPRSTSVRREQLVDQRPDARRAPACIRRRDYVGAVAEPQHPLRGVVAVVGELLDALARRSRPAPGRAESRSRSSSASRQVREHQQPGDQLGEVGVAALGQPDVAELASSRKNASVVLVAAACRRHVPARASSSRAWPSRSSAMLASAVSSSSSGARVTHCCSRCDIDQRVVAEHQAVRGQRRRRRRRRHGGVDAGQRVGEAGAERPALVVGLLGERLVGGVVVQSSLMAVALRCAGRRRGCRRTSGAGRPCRRWARRTGPSRPGWTR